MDTIQIIPDRFSGKVQDIAAERRVSGQVEFERTRRPTNGIQISKDTYASLRVMTLRKPLVEIEPSGDDYQYLDLIDAGGRTLNGEYGVTKNYSNFILQGVQEERAEKQQILETFGEPYIFFFGQRARLLNFNGVLLNTFDFNWEAEWWENYERYLRGTRCLQHDAIVILTFDNTMISGYITMSSATKSSQERNWINFQFQMFLTEYTTLTDVGNSSRFENKFLINIPDKAPDPSRPKYLTDPGYEYPDDMNKKSDSLVSSLKKAAGSSLATVKKAITTVTNNVDKITSKVNSYMNGVIVRVPQGFLGTVVMDDAYYVKPEPIVDDEGNPNVSTVIRKYFYQNDEEYIGSDTHYEGSNIPAKYFDPYWDLTGQEYHVQLIDNQFRAANINTENIQSEISKLISDPTNNFGLSPVNSEWESRNQVSSVAELRSSLTRLALDNP